MMRLLLAVLIGLLSAPTLAQSLEEVADDLRYNGLSALEVLALESFIAEWDGAAAAAFGVSLNQDVDLKQGWPNLNSGIAEVSIALHDGTIDKNALQQNMQTVLSSQNVSWFAFTRLNDTERTRMFVAAQGLRASAIRQANGDIEFCIFIIMCSDDGP